MRRRAAWIATLLLAACSPEPQPAHPALWQVEGPKGERAWLFGTIHALDRPADWRGARVEAALAGADSVAVEIAETDAAERSAVFDRMAQNSGLPPLSRRLQPAQRPALARLLAGSGIPESRFARTETWAAALTLARLGDEGLDAGNGIDRAVLKAAAGRTVIELEGLRGQLALFDGLAENEQRDLLELVIAEAGTSEGDEPALDQAWLKGDMAVIEAATHRGLLADPELRDVLFTARNRAMAERIVQLLTAGRRPFVAVGAAHMAGAEGLPALLAARGFKVTRLQ